jgi:RES domain-containing protein
VIAFRHADRRFPFLWEGSGQPAGRWNATGDSPIHYFADTPDGAWAEFLRHEGITSPEDLATITTPRQRSRSRRR